MSKRGRRSFASLTVCAVGAATERSAATRGQTGVAQSAPPHPASQLHRRLLRDPTQAPWPEQPLGQSARSHRTPDQPGSHVHLPGLLQLPCLPQVGLHAACSHSGPVQPSSQRQTGGEVTPLIAPRAGTAQ